MGSATFTRKRVGATLFYSDEMLDAVQFDLHGYAKELLERQLVDAGAVAPYNIEANRDVLEWTRPRKWWQRLLRRPAEVVRVPGVRYVASGWLWERTDG